MPFREVNVGSIRSSVDNYIHRNFKVGDKVGKSLTFSGKLPEGRKNTWTGLPNYAWQTSYAGRATVVAPGQVNFRVSAAYNEWSWIPGTTRGFWEHHHSFKQAISGASHLV